MPRACAAKGGKNSAPSSEPWRLPRLARSIFSKVGKNNRPNATKFPKVGMLECVSDERLTGWVLLIRTKFMYELFEDAQKPEL
jgi:hypothetical protein